jgi:hypothetical protein
MLSINYLETLYYLPDSLYKIDIIEQIPTNTLYSPKEIKEPKVAV